MIVCYFNVISVIVYPRETDTPLIVYADTVLPGTIAFQSFEPIAGRRKQILKIIRFVKVKQFPPGSSLNIRRNLSGNSDVENLVGFFISETFYHFFAHLSKLNQDSQNFKIAEIMQSLFNLANQLILKIPVQTINIFKFLTNN